MGPEREGYGGPRDVTSLSLNLYGCLYRAGISDNVRLYLYSRAAAASGGAARMRAGERARADADDGRKPI